MSALPYPRFDEGPILKRREITGASFLWCDAPRPEKCGVHSHEKVLVSFLLKGHIIEVDERMRKADTSSFSLHSTPPGMKHAHLIQSPRLTTLCFALEQSMLEQLGSAAKVYDDPVTARRGNVIALAPKLQRELFATDGASELVMHGLLFELTGELARRTENRLAPDCPSWLRKAKELLQDTWNQNIPMEEIAATVGVHPSHLNRVFRAQLNQTPGEYLRRIRMDRATREVLVSTDPLKAIAARAGFSDQAHFTREFRKQHGMSPLEMRRAIT